MSVLNVENLHTYFDTERGQVRAVDGIDLEIGEGEIVGLVGESGSGKSVTALSVLGLIDPPGRVVEGSIEYDGVDLQSLSSAELGALRGSDISMVFQDPMTAFNPTQTVGRQLHDVLRTHETGPVHPLVRLFGFDHSSEYKSRVIDALERVGIPSPESRYDDYPHEFSGGMLQRAMIAMSVLCDPSLVLADEPTTALDVTIERQILALFRELVDDLGTSVLWITHDISVVAALCDRVVVMYAGRVMEEGPVGSVLSDPQHPYTQGLLQSVPRYDEPDRELYVMEGSVPNPVDLPSQCRFADRCPEAHERCFDAHPELYRTEDGRAACYLVEESMAMEEHL
ncbi:ABC transporter ATP-binding protein [Haloprofundus salinisoli]|uniref:ABC transporter ATP-binding protein n=1 Tax=Haloprofundus salinisoli TaxID=2876193 RepID=UPI001CC9A23D|nr:ABC transporter ATP-binding protein [Haloprofundus salinisoli]